MNRPEVEGVRGCTDHSCIFGHPGGMGTNGGCHCLDAIRPLEQRRKAMRNIQLFRTELKRTQPAATLARTLAIQCRDSDRYKSDVGFQQLVDEVLQQTLFISNAAVDAILEQLKG